MIKIKKTTTTLIAAAFLLSCVNAANLYAGASYSVSGYTTNSADGSALSDVKVGISGDKEASVSSDSSGYYYIGDISDGSQVDVKASKDGYTAAPSSFRISNFNSDRTVNFRMTRTSQPQTSQQGQSIPTVPIPATGVTPTQPTYVAQTKPFFASDDSSQGKKDQAPKPIFSINGKVTYYASGLVGVKVMVNGDKKFTAVTDVNGYYSISGLKSGQKYAVSFSKDGFTFNPSETEISDRSQDITINAEGFASKYKIYGVLTDGKFKIEGVTIKVVSGVDEYNATTDSTGYYEIPNLSYGNNFTVTASKDGVVITPLKVNVNKLDNDRQVNFAALVQKFNISGKVTGPDDKPLKKASVELKTPYDKLTAVTSSKGAFMFEDVPSGVTYDLSASKQGYIPSDSAKVINLQSDQTLDFKLQADESVKETVAVAPETSESTSEQTSESDLNTALQGNSAEADKEIKTEVKKEKSRRVRSRVKKIEAEEKQPEETAAVSESASDTAVSAPAETPKPKKEVPVEQPKERKIKIKGRVGTKTEAFAGTELTLEPGGYKTSTDAKGRYSFEVPAPEGKYTLRPSAGDFYFDPPSIEISGAQASIVQDFFPYVQLEGTVYAEKKPVEGVVIQINGVQAAVTDYLGRFKTDNIEYGASVAVTVVKQGVVFYPPSVEYAKLVKNYQNLNFIAAYSASGRVTVQGSGFGLSNTSIVVSGSTTTSVTADYGGNFVIPGLESGGSFTIIPKAGGYSFIPPSRDITKMSGNVIGQNFAAVKETYTIRGNVNIGGKPLKNAIVSISKRALKYFTDNEGNFEISGLDYGGPYTVTVESKDRSFDPIVINTLNQNMQIEFSTDISLGGMVVSDGKPMPGVTVDVNGKKTKTDENGKYLVKGLKYDGDYLLTLSGNGMMFEPFQKEYKQIRQSILNEVFEASLVIGGSVTGPDGRPFVGAAITVSGDTTVYKSDDNGYYLIQNLKAGRNYTVEITSLGYVFSPPSREYKNIMTGSLSENFKAVKKNSNDDVAGYSVKGTVSAEGRFLRKVPVIVESSSSKAQVLTDDKGNFFVDNLAPDKKYTLTVQSKVHKFAAPSGVIESLSGNAEISLKSGTKTAVPSKIEASKPAAQQAVAAVRYTISGRVTLDGQGLKGVSVKGGSEVAMTNDAGEYSISVLKGYEATIEPSLAGYSFTPENTVLPNIGGDTANINFQAEIKVHTLSGYIVDKDHNGVKGVKLKEQRLTGDFATNAKGFYKIPGIAHKDKSVVVPESSKYNFYPESLNLSLEDDFVANDIYAYPKKIKKAESFISGGIRYDIYPDVNSIFIVLISPESGKVSISITDAQNNVVKEFETDISANAVSAIEWDGETYSSESAPSGRYTVTIKGAGFNGEIQEFNILR